mgnify:FL=1
MKFQYRYEKEAYLPIVEVILKFRNEKIRTDALIDSGAAMCLFKGEIGRALGIIVESGEKKIFQGVSAKLIGYIHEIEITIAEKTFKTKIAFSDDLSTSFNLLGRQGIFDKFSITFKEENNEIYFE